MSCSKEHHAKASDDIQGTLVQYSRVSKHFAREEEQSLHQAVEVLKKTLEEQVHVLAAASPRNPSPLELQR